MELQLVVDAIWDEDPNAQELAVRLTEVNDTFFSIIASVTPQPTHTISTEDPGTTGSQNNTDTPTLEYSVTPTLEGAKETAPAPTYTDIPPGPTATPDPATPTNTAAAPPSTNTAIPTNTDVPPTNTEIPPTNTSIPPTNTPLPPSNTPSPCGELTLSWFGRTSTRIGWTFNNSGNSEFVISSVQITWPASNDELELLSLDGDTFWTGSKSPPSTTISSGWIGGVSRRKINPFENTILRFWFNETSQSSPYSITVGFTNGCSKSASH